VAYDYLSAILHFYFAAVKIDTLYYALTKELEEKTHESKSMPWLGSVVLQILLQTF